MSNTKENEEDSVSTKSKIIGLAIFLVPMCVGLVGLCFGYTMIYTSSLIKIIVHSSIYVLLAAMVIYIYGENIWETIGLIVAIIELVVSILTISIGIGLSCKKDCEVEAFAVEDYCYKHTGKGVATHRRIFFDYHGVKSDVSDKKELTDNLNVPPRGLDALSYDNVGTEIFPQSSGLRPRILYGVEGPVFMEKGEDAMGHPLG